MVFIIVLILTFAASFLLTKLMRKTSPSFDQGYIALELLEHVENLNKGLPKDIQNGLKWEKVYVTKLKLGCLLRAEPFVYDSVDKKTIENWIRQEEEDLRFMDFICKLNGFQLIITIRNKANSEPKDFVFSKGDFE
jgi:hypothetical protein